jgi:hypothetical protein
MLVNAIQRPLGDQLGWEIGAVVVGQAAHAAPGAFMTKSSGSLSPFWIAEKAIRRPSGDHAKLRISV